MDSGVVQIDPLMSGILATLVAERDRLRGQAQQLGNQYQMLVNNAEKVQEQIEGYLKQCAAGKGIKYDDYMWSDQKQGFVAKPPVPAKPTPIHLQPPTEVLDEAMKR